MATTPTTKTCSTCKQSKPFGYFHKHKNGKHGLQANCKDCNTVQAYNANWKNIGISFTYPDFLALGAQKNWTCECCGKVVANSGVGTLKELAVDHDKATLKIRGLLCFDCNSGIGKLGDNAIGVCKALTYLLKY